MEGLAPIRDLPVRARAGSDDPQRQRAEMQALLAALPRPCFPIALDSRGEALASVPLAERLGRLRGERPHAIALLVGSDLGLEPSLLDQALTVLSLGPLAFSHERARRAPYEQH